MKLHLLFERSSTCTLSVRGHSLRILSCVHDNEHIISTPVICTLSVRRHSLCILSCVYEDYQKS